jgi:predicted restriction endonuclease
MFVKCQNCKKKFQKQQSQINRSPNHYCSRSSDAKKCELCDTLIYCNRKKCPECIKSSAPDYSLSEAIYKKHHKSSAFALVRSRARSVAKSLGMNKCTHCGYNKHVEIAHIKPISSFDLKTKISKINNKNNIIALCPNCHWEFDHQ